MVLDRHQREQIERQLKEHRHPRYEVDIELSGKEILNGFVVLPYVMRPERMTSLYLARWLYNNRSMYEGRVATDMGCGTGLQGVVMGKYGARRVIFSDISQEAVLNARENVEKFNLGYKSNVVRSDLFENLEESADFIVFNHPFFADDPIEEEPVSRTMLNKGDLIHRFLDDAKKGISENGIIIMPFFHLAGETNNPELQAPKHGYNVIERVRENINQTGILQKGEISIYQLTLER